MRRSREMSAILIGGGALALVIVIAYVFLRSSTSPKKREPTPEDLSAAREEERRLAQLKRDTDAQEWVRDLFKRVNLPALHSLFIQNIRKKQSVKLEMLTVVEGALWIVETRGWSGKTQGGRHDPIWITVETKSGEGSPDESASVEQENPFKKLDLLAERVTRIAKSKKLNKVPLKRVLVVTHGAAHIQDLKPQEIIFTLPELKAKFKKVSPTKLDGSLKSLWQIFNQMHREADPIAALNAHIELERALDESSS
jgi:hypothetical protein